MIDPTFPPSKLLAAARAKNAGRAAQKSPAPKAAGRADVATPDTLSASTSPGLKPTLTTRDALKSPGAQAASPPATPPERAPHAIDGKSLFVKSEVEFVCGLPCY